MKHISIIVSLFLLSTALFVDMAMANTGMHFMRIGRLWVNAEYDGAEGWGGEYAWPGGYVRYPDSGIRELWGGNVRKTGTLAGCTNWTGPDGSEFSYWTSGMYRTYDYDYLTYWRNKTDVTALLCVKQVLIQRWAQPNVIVNGINVTPDGGDNFLPVHENNTAIDPTLITERAINSVWRYTMGVEYNRMMYAYSTPKHQDYALYDITLTNNGKMYGLPEDPPVLWPNPDYPQIMEGQKITGFWWAQTMNPWNSRSGRDYSISTGNDEWGEFVAPFGDDRRFALFYDGDKPSESRMDFGDPSKDERWVEILSPAWLCVGALYADDPTSIGTDDPTQPRSTSYRQERTYDLGQIPKTMQDQYEAVFQEGVHYPLDSVTVDYFPLGNDIPSPYTCFGPYDLDFGQSFKIIYVIAAGGMSHELCVEYGKKAWDAGYTGPIMDEIKDVFLTGRDSVYKTLQIAADNVNNVSGQGRFNVPDAPRPPANMWITSEGPRIKISWSNESAEEPDFDTGVDDFVGYRVYRATGARDSVYHMIYEGTDNEIYDEDVILGFQYFYYVVGYDDGLQNWEEPGVSLESGRFYCWSGWAPVGAGPLAAPITSDFKMSNIKVVPNPYSAAGFTFPGEQDKILFNGLPKKCTINIYTTNGDFVHKIDHTDGSGNEAWDLRTEFNQYIVSDVYIYTVDSDLGTKVGKFIVIR
jgi:hypothetical protein